MQIGSPSWTRQHDALQRLTTMAQLQARCQEDEWVVDLLHVSGKMDMLITDLLNHEV